MNMRKILASLLALLMCLPLCACGQTKSDGYARESSNAYYAAPAPMPEAMLDMAYEAAEYETGGFGAKSSAAAKRDDASSDSAPEENPEKIIYSGDATVETTEFEKSVAALEQMIADCGGFVESSSVNGSNYYDSARGYASRRTASYTLRIPSARFSELMTGLSAIGSVPYTHTYTENVTAQYYDVQARLNALQAQEARLLEMMELAQTVEDIITIEDKLSDVRYRIDSLQSSLNNWDRRVSYSTLSVTLKEVQVYTPETVTQISYGEELVRAFTDALRNTRDFFKDLLLFLVSALPTLVILAALLFVFRPLLRRLWAGSKARRARRREAKAAKKAAKAAAVRDAGIVGDRDEKEK